MPYPKKLLNPNETVALDLHPHWWFFSEPVMALIGSIIAGILVLTMLDSGNTRKYLSFAALALIVLSAIWLLQRYSKWVTTNFVITSDRIIFRQGVVAKSGIEIPLDRVNNVNFAQSVFERMLGAGNLLIESGGEDGQQEFSDIRRPHEVQNLITAQAEKKIVGRMRSGSSPTPAAPDMASQLEKLEGLLQRGSLSQEEFDTQKRRLLEN